MAYMSSEYHVLSGKRVVATKRGPNAREVALDYVRAMGCARDEIIDYGVDGVSWRGAIYRARSVPDEPPAAPDHRTLALPPVWETPPRGFE